MTGQLRENLYTAKVLGIDRLGTRFVDPLRDQVEQVAIDLFGSGGTLGSSKASLTATGNLIDLDADADGYDGLGDRMEIATSEAEWTDVPFANAGATVYYIGARFVLVPAGAELGIDGLPAFSHYEERVGESGTPNSVTNPTASTTRMAIDSIVAPKWTAGTETRPVVVVLNTPETASGESIFVGTCELDSGDVVVDIPHVFGQSSPSTTAADYTVWVLGPRITTTDIRTNDNYWFLGTMTSGVFADTDQALIPNFGDLASAFSVQHNPSTGAHTNVTADDLEVGSPSGGGPYEARLTDTTDRVAIGTTDGNAAFGANGAIEFLEAASSFAAIIGHGTGVADPVLQVRGFNALTGLIFDLPDGFMRSLFTDLDINVGALGSNHKLSVRNSGGGRADIELNSATGQFLYAAARSYTLVLDPLDFDFISGTATYDEAANPPHMTEPSTGSAVGFYQLNPALGTDDNRSITLTGMAVRNERINVGDQVIVNLMSRNKDGSNAWTIEQTINVSGVSGGYVLDTASFTETWDTTKLWALRLNINPSVASDVSVTTVSIDYDTDAANPS